MKIRIVPYKLGSAGAKLLAQVLSTKLGYKVFRGAPRANRVNVHWGRPGPNKLESFQKFEQAGVSCVPYTSSKEVAQGWLDQGKTVFARTTGGQGGSGITIVQPGEVLPDRPLYTQYVKKKKEFRVHVYNGQAIDVQEKRRKNGTDSSLIRSHGNGYVFCHENIVEPDGLRVLGVAAVGALGLPLGAVDIIYNEHQNKLYVLEANSAPGLCPTTAEKYANAIQN